MIDIKQLPSRTYNAELVEQCKEWLVSNESPNITGRVLHLSPVDRMNGSANWRRVTYLPPARSKRLSSIRPQVSSDEWIENANKYMLSCRLQTINVIQHSINEEQIKISEQLQKLNDLQSEIDKHLSKLLKTDEQ